MSQLPATLFGTQMPQLSSDLMGQMGQAFSTMFNDMDQQTIRRLRVGATSFEIVGGQEVEQIPFGSLGVVLLASATCNHAVWYEKKFMPGQEPTQPDLVWMMCDPNKFPDALPAKFHKKIMLDNGREGWGFSINRRLVFALLRSMPSGESYLDLDNPVIFDAGSMSLFGKGVPEQNQYKWSGIAGFCRRMSNAQLTITPQMFLMRLVVDSKAPRGVVNFSPVFSPNGQLAFLSTEQIMAVWQASQRDDVLALARVRERLDLGGGTAGDITPKPVAAPSTAPAASGAAEVQTAAPSPSPAPNADGSVQGLLSQAQAVMAAREAEASQLQAFTEKPQAAPTSSVEGLLSALG